MLLRKGLNTYEPKEIQSLSACRLKESGEPRTRTWPSCQRWSENTRTNSHLSRLTMLKENTTAKLMPRQI
nr:hypothetical protein Iba_chr11bCG2390 [Ipomoea batatas]